MSIHFSEQGMQQGQVTLYKSCLVCKTTTHSDFILLSGFSVGAPFFFFNSTVAQIVFLLCISKMPQPNAGFRQEAEVLQRVANVL